MVKVSIIVPIYNVELFIARCAVSLFEQTYDNIEYIFVNDNTKDKSVDELEKVVEKYFNRKDKIKILKHEKNEGVGKARLTGLLASNGEYVWFVDSDDWVEKNALELCKNSLESGVDLIMMNYIAEFENNSKQIDLPSMNVDNILKNELSPSLWKYIIKRDLLINNNILPIEGINYAEDFLFTAEMALVVKTHFHVCNYLYHYNCYNSHSCMQNINTECLEHGARSAIKVYDFYKSKSQVVIHRRGILFMLCKRYFALYYREPDNSLLVELKERIHECDRFWYVYLQFMPFFSNLLMRIYRHFV